jgi:microcin C transport system permease protein
VTSQYRGAQGLDPEFIAKLEAQFGFDKPPLERFGADDVELYPLRFRRELFPQHRRDRPDHRKNAGFDLARRLDPAVSYIISIPLGIKKAVSDGSRFDVWTSGLIIVAYAVPGFLFGILLIVLFAGGSFWTGSRCAG